MFPCKTWQPSTCQVKAGPGVHAHRTAAGDCHHRHPCGVAASGIDQRKGQGRPGGLPEQQQANWAGGDPVHLRRRRSATALPKLGTRKTRRRCAVPKPSAGQWFAGALRWRCRWRGCASEIDITRTEPRARRAWFSPSPATVEAAWPSGKNTTIPLKPGQAETVLPYSSGS